MKPQNRVAFLFSIILILSFLSILSSNNLKVNAQIIYTDTFYPQDISGWIRRNSTSYPFGTSFTEVKDFPSDQFPLMNSFDSSMYYIARSYLSFDTSSLLDEGINLRSASLYVAPWIDQSEKDFNVIVFSGENQWTSEGTCTWNKCPTYEAIILNTLNLICEKYYSCNIAIGSISTTGKTQFRLINGNEITTPTSAETILLYEWNNTDWKPYLQIKWSYAYESKLTSIDIFNMNQAISDALGLNSPFLGGLILSFSVIFGFIVLPLACLRAPLVAYAVMIFGVAGIFIVLGWLPTWFVFMEVFLIAIMLSSTISKILTGET